MSKEKSPKKEVGVDTVRHRPPNDARRLGRQIDQELYDEQIREAFAEAEKMADKQKLAELAKLHKQIEDSIDNLGN